MAVLSKVCVCAFHLVGLCPARGMDSFSLVSVACCQVEVSAMGWPLILCSPTECGVSECDCEATILRRRWLTRGCCAMELQTGIS
jgi:hypothetical protein